METQVKSVYKVVRVDNGVLKSVYAGHYTGIHFVEDLQGVTYKEGQITYAPQGQKGLAVWDTLEQAILFSESNSTQGKQAVYEATGLGNRDIGLQADEGASTYPAILLGKEVWREEPKPEPRPEPKFKVGDRVKGISSYAVGQLFTITRVQWSAEGGLRGMLRLLHLPANQYLYSLNQ